MSIGDVRMSRMIQAVIDLRNKQMLEELKTPNQVREELGIMLETNTSRFDIVCYECRLTYTPIKDGYSNKEKIKVKVVGENVVRLACSECGTEVHIHDGEDI